MYDELFGKPFDDLVEEGKKELSDEERMIYEFKVCNWISKCRSYVSEHMTINTTPPEEYEMVKSFTDAWLEHYINNKGFYEEEIYKKCLVYLGKEKIQVYISFPDDETIELTNVFYYSITDNFNLVKDYAQAQYKEYKTYWEKVRNIDKYVPKKGETIRSYIVKEIIKGSKMKSLMRNYTLEKGTALGTEKIEEFKTKIKRLLAAGKHRELLEYMNKVDYEIKLKVLSPEVGDMVLLKAFRNYGVSKNIWYNSYSIGANTKNIEKYFFYNLCLFLDLDVDTAEKFMNIHGFSITRSWEPRDIFFRNAITIGFNKGYIFLLSEKMDEGGKRYFNLKPPEQANQNSYLMDIYRYQNGIPKPIYSKTVKDKVTGNKKKVYEERPVTRAEYIKALKTANNKIEKALKIEYETDILEYELIFGNIPAEKPFAGKKHITNWKKLMNELKNEFDRIQKEPI